MIIRLILIFLVSLLTISCSKDQDIKYENSERKDPYKIYQEGLKAFESKDYFFASKKFDEAELNFEQPELAAKSSLMSSYSLYGINFYNQAEANLKRYLDYYRADKNIIYAHYLLSIIYYEQIQDEKKDLKPLIKAEKKINFFLENYPNSDYATDLRFKKDLIQNQLAAKELYVAKYYISVQKWVPAINRLKIILEKYDKTVFIEEALHRLVEIHYYLGLENEAKNYVSLLGYNYNSSEWYEQSYKILNKDYGQKKKKTKKKLKEKNLLEKIIKIIR
jgi:outer membrane protein assembly factor BamD